MGNIFDESDGFPTHRPPPFVPIELVGKTVIPVMIAIVLTEHEHGHPHDREPADTTPRATRDIGGYTTSASATPYFGVVDSNDVAIGNRRWRDQATWRAISATTSVTAPFPGLFSAANRSSSDAQKLG